METPIGSRSTIRLFAPSLETVGFGSNLIHRGGTMDRLSDGHRPSTRWSIEDIPFQDLDHDAVHDDRHLFYSLAAASFVEITSDLYTSNLIAFFQGDDEVVSWLSRQWEPEELQHGATLKRYVETAWPEFDWNAAYRG